MVKNKQALLLNLKFFSCWISSFMLGIAIGITSQQTPLLRTYTNQFLEPIELSVLVIQVYLSHDGCDGKRYVTYPVIGPQEVAVLTHFFKVLKQENWHGNHEIKAYIFPNQPISSNMPLGEFESTLEKLEKCAGLIFHNNIPLSCPLRKLFR
ncbi:unnamed protein product [Candidatus Protochlamydia amoebophila UWE25]|uniref:ENPP1-3/EXOG-like endonuclease/phosphodiesterase domain-containing protein n=2 Tax=Candidatus Protochlamydia amoebophila TaxID=362787 RepID=A0A2P9HB57_PARUW|nr:unnamed protein product [Candidatus Protochlamydia amoebophila UWE25]